MSEVCYYYRLSIFLLLVIINLRADFLIIEVLDKAVIYKILLNYYS